MQASDERFPRVLVRGNTLVRVAERGALEDLDATSLRNEISKVSQFFKRTAKGPVPIDPPVSIAQTLQSDDSAEYGDLPRVDRFVDVPVLSASGKLITEPGHHPEDRLFYQPAPGLEGVRGGTITLDSLLYARELILGDLLGNFDFREESDMANAVGQSFLPFVREHIGDHPTPAHAWMGHEPGVGKSFGAEISLIPGCGNVAIQADAEGEEWRKRVTALLVEGVPAILLDNFTTLRSGTLAAALTSTRWTDRILGESRIVSCENRAIWVITGNNLRVSPENLQRIVWIELDPGDKPVARARPKSSFRHSDLREWALENRRRLVQAYLTVIEAWGEGIYLSPVDEKVPSLHQRGGGSPNGESFDTSSRRSSTSETIACWWSGA